MTATKHLLPEEIIAAAEAEISEAVELAETLEARVLEGDDSVSFDQVEKARGLQRFAQMRKTAAEKRAAKLAEQLAEAEFNAFLTENLVGAQGHDETVDALLAEARTLIDQALVVAKTRDKHVFALAKAATTEGNPWDADMDPELIGQGQVPQLAWFKARGVRMSYLGPAGVFKKLLTPYKSTFPTSGPGSEFRAAID